MKIFYYKKMFKPVFCITIVSIGVSLVYGQSVSPAPEVRPIVDPLSEMTPSPTEETGNGILDLDIEQLGKVNVEVPAFDVEVTTVGKRESTIGKSPAAVYVITNEMILRSGATCIPEILRLAPGVEVARINSHSWAITIRGFNDRYANKLLVLVDGRSIYSPVISGTFWDMVDMPLNDIDRIEIIRGPGGTLWGANAVNGIINIISKSAKETQGVLAKTGGGSQDYNISTVRYGGKMGKNVWYRAWGKYFDRGPEDSVGHYDDWHAGRSGFHADWNPGGSRDDLITAEGNFFAGKEGERYTLMPPGPGFPRLFVGHYPVAETSFLTRWVHTIDEKTDWALQAYYDQIYRSDPQTGMTINTFDIDFQYRFPVGRRHSIITGVEYRETHDFLQNPSYTIQFFPTSRCYNIMSGFLQDEIELVDDKFYLTVGTKIERNSFSGFEYQPSVRAFWSIDDRHVLWGAISRAVRTPNRFEENVEGHDLIAYPPFTFLQIEGSPDVKSEDVMAYELGYRTQMNDRFAWDIATFFNKYRQLIAFVPLPPQPNLIPYGITNCGNGEAYGYELTAEWQATERWKLAGSYSFLFCGARYPADALPSIGSLPNDPRNQVRLQSYWNFAPNWQLDSFLRYVDQLNNNDTPSYITMDVRLGWQPNKNLDFSIVGQNLFAPHHLEYVPFALYKVSSTEINRAVYARVTLTR